MVNWRPIEGAMSFAEQALHLMECDRYLFDKLDDKVVQPVDGPTDRFEATSQSQYSSLVTDIERTGRQRAGRLEKLSEVDFSRRLDDRRFGGEVTLWWLVVRGNLDHEIHHRGQLAAYLRMSGIVKD